MEGVLCTENTLGLNELGVLYTESTLDLKELVFCIEKGPDIPGKVFLVSLQLSPALSRCGKKQGAVSWFAAGNNDYKISGYMGNAIRQPTSNCRENILVVPPTMLCYFFFDPQLDRSTKTPL